MKERVAVITGGHQGIGAATAWVLLKRGYSGIASISKSGKSPGSDQRLKSYQADVTYPEELERARTDILNDFSRVDVLINNAGIVEAPKPLQDTDLTTWERVIGTNLTGVFNTSRVFIPSLIETGHQGRIINVSSLAAITGYFGHVAYAASKAGVNGLTLTLAKELARHRITVNAICCGPVVTDMTEQLSDTERQRIIDKIPLGRFAKPCEIARIIAHYASPHAELCTGELRIVDGGMSL